MTTPTNPSELFSPFLPAFVIIPDDNERLRTFLQEKFSAISDVVNDKMIGAFTQNAQEFSGAKWSYDTTKKVRSGFQTVARITSWISQTIPMPIGDIGPQWVASQIYATANLPCTAIGANDGDYFSFYGAGNPHIQFTVSDTQIVITTDGSTAAYSGFIVISYIRDGDDEP